MTEHVAARDDAPEPGRSIGPYRLEELLGEGGMGRVFRARAADGSEVAVKVLKSRLAGDELYNRRFSREARAATAVDHKHLVGVLDFGVARGRQYLAMHYVAGESLDRRLTRQGPLPIDEVIRIVAEVGAGLDALHRARVVHRDVKPSNVMLDATGRALLTDFGLAKGEGYSLLSTPGQVIGTVDYLAPELVRGNPATPLSDIYALGCVAYECLAGRPPFGGKSLIEAGMAILDATPDDPCARRADAGRLFSETVLRALAKDPAERPPTATAYGHLLRAAALASGD